MIKTMRMLRSNLRSEAEYHPMHEHFQALLHQKGVSMDTPTGMALLDSIAGGGVVSAASAGVDGLDWVPSTGYVFMFLYIVYMYLIYI
jgi:hypothetical protein